MKDHNKQAEIFNWCTSIGMNKKDFTRFLSLAELFREKMTELFLEKGTDPAWGGMAVVWHRLAT